MILHRYISLESLKSTAAVTATLLIIVLSSRLVQYLAEISTGALSPDSLILLVLFRIPNFLEMLLPLGFFIALLLVFGRLYIDSEIAVMNSCGISPLRLLQMAWMPILLVSLITGWLSLYLTPESLRAYEAVIKDNKRSAYSAAEGKFMLDQKSGRTTYIEQYSPDDMSMSGIFTSRPMELDDGRLVYSIVNAESGKLGQDPESEAQYLLLDDGFRLVGQAGNLDFQITRFKRYAQSIPDNTVNRFRNIKDGMTSLELFRSKLPEHKALLQWRISLPLIVPIISILAIGLSRTDQRNGRYAKLFPAIMIYMSYLLLLNTVRASVAEDKATLIPSFFLVHMGFFIAGLVILLWPNIKIRALKRQRQ